MKQKQIFTILILLMFLQIVAFAKSKQTEQGLLSEIKLTHCIKGSIYSEIDSTLQLGKYILYAGIPSMYIGRFELKEGGNYLVSLSSDEDSYATGTYMYHANDNSIEWTTGFFWQKKYGGKIVQLPNGNYKIEFNKATYGQKDGK